MSGLVDLFAPVALVLTAQPAGPGTVMASGSPAVATALTPQVQDPATAPQVPSDSSHILLLDAARVPVQNQVRIERRIVVRITPRSRAPRQDLMAMMPRQPLSRSYEEENAQMRTDQINCRGPKHP